MKEFLDPDLDAYDIKDGHDCLAGLANVRELVGNALTALTQYAYLTDEIIEQGLKEADWIDLGIMWRDLENGFNDARKEALKRKEKCGELFAMSRARKIAKDPTNSETGQGRLGRARADVKVQPSLPGRNTPEFANLMRFLGVNEFAISEKLLSFNWSHVSDYLSACAVEGKTPPFTLRTENKMTATFTKNRSPK